MVVVVGLMMMGLTAIAVAADDAVVAEFVRPRGLRLRLGAVPGGRYLADRSRGRHWGSVLNIKSYVAEWKLLVRRLKLLVTMRKADAQRSTASASGHFKVASARGIQVPRCGY